MVSSQFPTTLPGRRILPSHRIFNRRVAPARPDEITLLSHNKIIRYAAPFEQNEFTVLRGSSFNRKAKAPEVDKDEKENPKTIWTTVPGFAGLWRIAPANAIFAGNKKIKYCHYGVDCFIRIPHRFGLLVSIFFTRNKTVSSRTAEKIRSKTAAFFRVIPRNARRFLTLSFIDFVTHREATKILDNFFKQLRKEFPCLEYLWVCELQKNGNKHFHILINKHINIFRLNALWVLNQYNRGLKGFSRKENRYIDIKEIRERHKVSLLNAASNFRRDKGGIGELFNPVDIKKIHNTNGVVNYITKYLNKCREQVFDGLKFHCSRGVSKLFTKMMVDESTYKMLSNPDHNFYIDKKTGEIKTPTPYFSKYAICIAVYNRKISEEKLKYMDMVNRLIIEKIYPPEIPVFHYSDFVYNCKN